MGVGLADREGPKVSLAVQPVVVMRASAWVRNARRWINSHSGVAKKLSAMALSKQSPADPVEVRTPISWQRLPKAATCTGNPCRNDDHHCEAAPSDDHVERPKHSPVRRWWAMAYPTTWVCPNFCVSSAVDIVFSGFSGLRPESDPRTECDLLSSGLPWYPTKTWKLPGVSVWTTSDNARIAALLSVRLSMAST